jgi:hypothetical protein
LRLQIGQGGAARQMPGRPAFLPGTAMHSGRVGYPRNASIMPGNLFMFHYRVFAAVWWGWPIPDLNFLKHSETSIALRLKTESSRNLLIIF